MVFNGPLVPSRYKNHLPNARSIGFLYRVLNQRLINDRKHFFRNRQGRGQEARTHAPNREHGLSNYRGCGCHDVSLIQLLKAKATPRNGTHRAGTHRGPELTHQSLRHILAQGVIDDFGRLRDLASHIVQATQLVR